MDPSMSWSLPTSTMHPSNKIRQSSNHTSFLNVPQRESSRPSSRQSTNTASRSVSASAFFKKLLAIPKFTRRRRGGSDETPTSALSSSAGSSPGGSYEDLGNSSPASSATEVDSDDCELVGYHTDVDDVPATLRGSSSSLSKLSPSPPTPSFSDPFNTYANSPARSCPTLSTPSPTATPITTAIPLTKKQPKRNPHRVHDLSDFIATRRTSALMCPPPSPGFSSSFHPSQSSTTAARRRSSCKGSFSSYTTHGGQSSPYRKYCFATEDSRHDYQPLSPKRTSYGAGETQPVASLPIPPWRRYRKAPPPVDDVESQQGSCVPLAAW